MTNLISILIDLLPQGYKVSSIKIHERYNKQTNEFDIAIITLKTQLDLFDPQIKSIDLNYFKLGM